MFGFLASGVALQRTISNFEDLSQAQDNITRSLRNTNQNSEIYRRELEAQARALSNVTGRTLAQVTQQQAFIVGLGLARQRTIELTDAVVNLSVQSGLGLNELTQQVQQFIEVGNVAETLRRALPQLGANRSDLTRGGRVDLLTSLVDPGQEQSFRRLFGSLSNLLASIGQLLDTVIGPVLNAIGSILNSVGTGLRRVSDFLSSNTALRNAITGTLVIGTLTAAIPRIVTLMGSILAAVQNLRFTNLGGGALGGILGGAGGRRGLLALPRPRPGLTDARGSLLSRLTTPFRTETATAGGRGITAGIGGVIGNFSLPIFAVMTKVLAFLGKFLIALGGLAVIFTLLDETVKQTGININGFRGIFKDITEQFNELTNSISKLAQATDSFLRGLVQSIADPKRTVGENASASLFEKIFGFNILNPKQSIIKKALETDETTTGAGNTDQIKLQLLESRLAAIGLTGDLDEQRRRNEGEEGSLRRQISLNKELKDIRDEQLKIQEKLLLEAGKEVDDRITSLEALRDLRESGILEQALTDSGLSETKRELFFSREQDFNETLKERRNLQNDLLQQERALTLALSEREQQLREVEAIEKSSEIFSRRARGDVSFSDPEELREIEKARLEALQVDAQGRADSKFLSPDDISQAKIEVAQLTEELANLELQSNELTSIAGNSLFNFFDGLVDRTQTFGELLKDLVNDITRSLLRLFTQLAVQRLALAAFGSGTEGTQLGNFFAGAVASFPDGGFVKPGDGPVIAPDGHMLISAQAGEFISSRDSVANARSNAGGQGGNIIVAFSESDIFAALQKAGGQATIVRAIGNNKQVISRGG